MEQASIDDDTAIVKFVNLGSKFRFFAAFIRFLRRFFFDSLQRKVARL